MIRCPGCGAGAADDATRCVRCGRTLAGEIAFLVPDAEAIEDAPTTIVESPPRRGALLALAAAGAAILALLALPGGPDGDDGADGPVEEATPSTAGPTPARPPRTVVEDRRFGADLVDIEPAIEATGDTAPELAGHRLAVLVEDRLWLVDAATGDVVEARAPYAPERMWVRGGRVVVHSQNEVAYQLSDPGAGGTGVLESLGRVSAVFPDPGHESVWLIDLADEGFDVRVLRIADLALVRSFRIDVGQLLYPLAVSEAGVVALDVSLREYVVVGIDGTVSSLPTAARDPVPFTLSGRLLALTSFRVCRAPCDLHIVDLVERTESVIEIPVGHVAVQGGLFSRDGRRLVLGSPVSIGPRLVDLATSEVTSLEWNAIGAPVWTIDGKWLLGIEPSVTPGDTDPGWNIVACPVDNLPCFPNRVVVPVTIRALSPEGITIRPTAAPGMR